ncbi:MULTISPECIES: hypothetical protein [Prochlorococcus]|uniref:hypothetical protein n=1 Tax=Prochlorococcus TaxID=1218 RepID=UPI000533B568|nr:MULTISPECIES: hypothetical protein [Prochlorococcus]KGG11896.1 putative membrane protein [Prochlorococcus sp. MIT 0601]
MSKALTQRAEELRSLGWTDDGAKRYSDLLDQSQIKEAFSEIDIVFALVALFIIFFCVAVYVRNYYYIPNQKSEKPVLLFQEPIDIQESIEITNVGKKNVPEITFLKSTANVITSTASAIDRTIDPIISNQENKKPFISYFTDQFKDTSIDTNKLAEHILLATLLTSESIVKALKLASPSLRSLNRKDPKLLGKAKVKEALAAKSDNELRDILEGVEVLSNCDNKQLTELILSNPKAFKKASIEERKIELLSMKNAELRKLLKGVNNISRLKKSQLVEKLLSIEYDQ